MLKIIIVEENPVMTISLKKILTLLPEINTIEEAVNGQKLFQLVEEFNLDVVFLDLDSTEGYIINAEMVLEITPWGNKTYLVKLMHTDETVLITVEKAKEFRKKFC